mgnify:FL=1
MKIRGKGEIKPGYDADFVILNDQLEIERVISSGRRRIVNN